MKIVDIATDSVYVEYDGWRYQVEVPNWRSLDIFKQSGWLNCFRCAILERGDFTEIETPKYKLIKIGPV